MVNCWQDSPFDFVPHLDRGLETAFSDCTSNGDRGKVFEVAAGKKIPQSYHFSVNPEKLPGWNLKIFLALHSPGHYQNNCP